MQGTPNDECSEMAVWLNVRRKGHPKLRIGEPQITNARVCKGLRRKEPQITNNGDGRDGAGGERVAAEIVAGGGRAEAWALDVADPAAISTFAGEVRLFTHEARHATQYACCGGVLMLPLYGIAAAVSWALCGDFGARNVFEQRAGLAGGGYTEKDLRPVLRRRTSRPARRRPAWTS